MLPDFDRADAIGTFWGHPETRTFGELLIDLEEDKAARAVVFGLLAEMERRWPPRTASPPSRLGDSEPVGCFPPVTLAFNRRSQRSHISPSTCRSPSGSMI
jgi:hypothetical protein